MSKWIQGKSTTVHAISDWHLNGLCLWSLYGAVLNNLEDYEKNSRIKDEVNSQFLVRIDKRHPELNKTKNKTVWI